MSEPLWRVGRQQPINLYRGDEYVGVAFGSPAIAAAIVARMNDGKTVPPEVGVDWGAVEVALELPFPAEHAAALQGAFNILLQRQKDAVDGLEKYMRLIHEDCAGVVERTFEACRADFCVAGRAKLDELRGIGE